MMRRNALSWFPLSLQGRGKLITPPSLVPPLLLAHLRYGLQESGSSKSHEDRTYENQQHRASGPNLLVTAIILWNTRYLERAIAALRQAENVPDQLLAHLSPLGWEHVNLTGDYIWSAEQPDTENPDGFRPLRTAPDAPRKAA
jgi:hypothetical protein